MRRNEGQSPIQYATVILVIVALAGSWMAYYAASNVEVGGGEGEEVTEGVLHAEDMIMGSAQVMSGDIGWIGKSSLETTKAIQDKLREYRGETFEIVKADAETSPTAGKIAVEKLLSNGCYAGIGTNSFTIRSVFDEYVEAGMPTLVMGGTPWLDGRGGEYVFRGFPSDTAFVTSLATILTEDVKENDWPGGNIVAEDVSLIATDDPGNSDTQGLLHNLSICMGQEILAEELVPPGKGMYSSTISKVIAGDPDALWITAGTKDSWTMTKNAVEAGYHGPILHSTTDTTSQEFVDLAHPLEYIENVYVVGTSGVGSSKPALQDLHDMVGSTTSTGTCSYDLTSILLLALEAAEVPVDASLSEIRQAIADNIRYVTNPPGEKVYTLIEGLKALEEGKDIDFVGVYGDRNYDSKGEVWPVQHPFGFQPEEGREFEKNCYAIAEPSSDLVRELAHCVIERRK